MTLFDECIQALSANGSIAVLDKKCSDIFIKKIREKVVFTKWGRIDWNSYTTFETISIEMLCHLTGDYFVFWDEANLPVIKTDMKNITSNIDDILAVDFNTWVVKDDYSYIIELFHDGSNKILDLNGCHTN